MARQTEKWAQAKAYFEIGKSLTFISDTLDLEKSTISKRAKREGWIKGEYQQLCDDSVRINHEIFNLVQPLRSTVENDIEDRTQHLRFISHATYTNVGRMMQKFDPKSKEYQKEMSFMDHKMAQSTIKDARESLIGKENQSKTELQINNAPAITNVTYEVINASAER